MLSVGSFLILNKLYIMHFKRVLCSFTPGGFISVTLAMRRHNVASFFPVLTKGTRLLFLLTCCNTAPSHFRLLSVCKLLCWKIAFRNPTMATYLTRNNFPFL